MHPLVLWVKCFRHSEASGKIATESLCSFLMHSFSRCKEVFQLGLEHHIYILLQFYWWSPFSQFSFGTGPVLLASWGYLWHCFRVWEIVVSVNFLKVVNWWLTRCFPCQGGCLKVRAARVYILHRILYDDWKGWVKVGNKKRRNKT